MRTTCIKFGIVLACFAGTAASLAPTALATYKVRAEEIATGYAEVHYSFPTPSSCVASGKNERGVAQYYCSGKFQNRGGEYHINVGPYEEITYQKE